jgi:hypothetical protein
MRNPYDVLGVARSASAAELTAAFLGLVRKLHPDEIKPDPAVASRFAEIKTSAGPSTAVKSIPKAIHASRTSKVAGARALSMRRFPHSKSPAARRRQPRSKKIHSPSSMHRRRRPMIVKEGNKFSVKSEKGKNLGVRAILAQMSMSSIGGVTLAR